ncbi:cilia- and flagella-associated protein 251 [Sceloporus undulatus]|uniref:cilia- and flagella-associated protein 251 n=1 Tax=Sceloporus undulatus TaxID=8520 RepID=UPI001C4DCEFF|nr:cilia- and flagella-associated protein 251 [Sceloporus undulatus]
MEEDSSKPETPQGTEESEPGAEIQREEMPLAESAPAKSDLPSQARQGLEEEAQDSAGPMEATQRGKQASQGVKTSISPGPPETSQDTTASANATEMSITEEKEPGIPAQKGQAPKEDLQATHKPGGVRDDKEEGDQTGLEKGQDRSQTPEAGPKAATAETHRPQSQEQDRRSPSQPPPLLSESTAGQDGQGSPVMKGGSSETGQEVGLVLRPQEPLGDNERVSQETGIQTAQEEHGPSQAQTHLASLTPAEEEKSIVSTAAPAMMLEDETRPLSDHPLSLSWVFGYNNKLPVFNLLDEDFRVILYVSSHTAVIHDVFRNKQYPLQGHSSCISCICLSQDRRWIVTADRGPDSLIIIWDGYSAVPVHTIFDSHPEGGVSAVAISHDSTLLATVGAGEEQKISIWSWTLGDTDPDCSVKILPQYGFQNYIAFHSRDHNELVSNSEIQVIFYMRESSVLHYFAPMLTEKTFEKTVGLFSQTLFHFSTDRAITATLEGKIALWGPVCLPSQDPVPKPYSMKAIKLIHLQKDGITVLATTDKMFVTCDNKGHVKFYDGDLQLLYWYSKLKIGPIRSISFSKKKACPVDISKLPISCTLAGEPFIVRNFIISSSNSVVIHVKPEGLKVSKCLEEPKDAVHAITCHPSKPLMAKGSFCGLLKVWNYSLNKYLVSRIFKDSIIRTLCYNHDGSLLGAGFENGYVYLLDAISLENDYQKPLQYSKGPLTHMAFSHNSEYFATADENISVNLYTQFVKDGIKFWDLLAALHSHYKPVCALLFGLQLDSDEPRLLSLGEDRFLVEYDLANSTRDNLVVLRRDRIEQSAIPKCITWYPPLTMEYFLLTANDEYKMKMYNVTTKLCRKTILGPTYGSPLQKILVLPVKEGDDPQKRYLAYITKDKVGLQVLPVDGNPHKSSAFICHPAGVCNLACSYDGRHLFTAGGSDSTVMKWDINLSALEAAVLLGGEDLIPYYNFLENGREGMFFKELEDYFYYAQLCHQGINTMVPRKVSTHIPLEQIPFVMRAMGFYPTEDQIENMLNEVKFSEFLETGKQMTHIDLRGFIKLYINHRPAFGLSAKEIQQAFQVLGYENEDRELAINRNDLLLLLQHRGEHFTEEELAECLTTLLGVNPEGGRAEVGTYDPTGADVFIEEGIPEEITAEHFIMDILGLPVPEPTLREAETPNEPTSCDLVLKS